MALRLNFLRGRALVPCTKALKPMLDAAYRRAAVIVTTKSGRSSGGLASPSAAQDAACLAEGAIAKFENAIATEFCKTDRKTTTWNQGTIHAVLDRHGLVRRREKRRARATGMLPPSSLRVGPCRESDNPVNGTGRISAPIRGDCMPEGHGRVSMGGFSGGFFRFRPSGPKTGFHFGAICSKYARRRGYRRGGRVVDRTALEMRHTGNRIGGSNPSLSANGLSDTVRYRPR